MGRGAGGGKVDAQDSQRWGDLKMATFGVSRLRLFLHLSLSLSLSHAHMCTHTHTHTPPSINPLCLQTVASAMCEAKPVREMRDTHTHVRNDTGL